MCPAYKWLKTWNLGGPVGGRPPILIPPIFVKFYLFLIFAYSENFICLA